MNTPLPTMAPEFPTNNQGGNKCQKPEYRQTTMPHISDGVSRSPISNESHSQTASPVDGFVRSTERATLHMTSARVTEIDKDGTAINAQPVKSKMELEREVAQVIGRSPLSLARTLQHESGKEIEALAQFDIPSTEHDNEGQVCSAQAGNNIVMNRNQLANAAVGARTDGEIVMTHETFDVEAQEYGKHCKVPIRFKQSSVYRAFMGVAALITLVVTGYYGAKSAK